MKFSTAGDALSIIKSGQRLFVHGSAATPLFLLRELEKKADELERVELVSISLLGDIPLAQEKYDDKFIFNSLFVSAPIRRTVNAGPSDYIPVFLSEIHKLFQYNYLELDVALIHVSPPDQHGFCSLGVSVDIARAAVRASKKVIAQVNPKMPRTHGEGLIHCSEIDFFVETNDDLPVVDYLSSLTESDLKIGKFCAELIPNGATVQAGIGCIPDAVWLSLKQHKDLGVHTEMFSNGVLDLLESGVITNKFKKKYKGRIVTSFAIGSRKLYDYINDNPLFAFLEASFVNDERVIRSNPKVAAVNSALEIDLTGQVCADSLGAYQYSGVGGQMDFIRGASFSENGIPIIALPSVTKKGQSKIVPFLKEGAGVVTTRAHAHYIVTEYGSVNLFGKNLRQRAELLCQIAHPDHREALDREITNRFGAKLVGFYS